MQIKLSEYGFVRAGVATPELRVGDVEFNTEIILSSIDYAASSDCHFVVFPELSITSYTCGDLFYQSYLLEKTIAALRAIASYTLKTKTAVIVGAPIAVDSRLFNCAVFISSGRILGIVPKTYIPNTHEYYEARWFASSVEAGVDAIYIGGEKIPFGTDLLFTDPSIPGLKIGIEICEDLWAVEPPSLSQSLAGALILANLSASNELLGKAQYRKDLVRTQSARCYAAYLYSSSGPGESSTDLLFSGHSIIAENGSLLAETTRFNFETQLAIADIDLQKLQNERLKNSSYGFAGGSNYFRNIEFSFKEKKVRKLFRKVNPHPFVPHNKKERSENCLEIFSIQTTALAKRLRHIGCEKVTIGISGGLDSTLALLVAYKTFEKLNLDKTGILAVSMPGFGTTRRTSDNAKKLAAELGVSFLEISIIKSVEQHFKDIGQNPHEHDITYENAQARERTQILMDIANKEDAIVIGTGDLSELAMGWATYNGDHMSMYSVNAGVPKTLVRYLIEWCAEEEFTGTISNVLKDISNTPISPELLPVDESGNNPQHTESKIGPYELHDFFLYNFIRFNSKPSKILLLAEIAFKNKYDRAFILENLKIFFTRFFQNQFKRSCMPDGVKVGTVSLSPRGDWRMPSDASITMIIKELSSL